MKIETCGSIRPNLTSVILDLTIKEFKELLSIMNTPDVYYSCVTAKNLCHELIKIQRQYEVDCSREFEKISHAIHMYQEK